MSQSFPSDLHYLSTHEYARVAGSDATIGITAYAVEQLGDVVFVDMPEVGRQINKGDIFGAIESVKAVSDLYSPVSGEVIEVNGELDANPALINDDPYGEGWLIKLKLSAPGEVDGLLDAQGYQTAIEESED